MLVNFYFACSTVYSLFFFAFEYEIKAHGVQTDEVEICTKKHAHY
jgi:hypothetical protein